MSIATRFTLRQGAVIIFCMVFLFTSLMGFAFQRRFLLEPFAATQATVTTVEPQNHGKVFYSYVVGDATFTGIGWGSRAEPGTQIEVYRLLADPAVSTDRDPSSGFAGLLGTALLSGLFMSGGSCFIIRCLVQYIKATRVQTPTA